MPQAHLTRSPGNVFTECKNPRTVRELHLSGVRSREWLPQPAQNRQVPVPKMARVLRRYHYLSVVKEDREGTRLVRERVKCGKPSCRYAQDVRHRHGPYLHVRYEEYDRRTGETSFRGSTFPRVSSRGCATESAARGPAGARGREIMAFLRRYIMGGYRDNSSHGVPAERPADGKSEGRAARRQRAV